MSEDAEAIELLSAALRSRAATVAELAVVAHLPASVVAELVRTLADRGLLDLAEGRILYRRPDATVIDHARSTVRGAAGELERALDAAQSLFAAVPALLREWEAGSADEHALRIDVLHGPGAPIELWQLQATRGTPVLADAVIPDVSALLEPDPSRHERFRRRMTESLRRTRLILSVADATAPEAQEAIGERIAQGMEIRMLPEPPSWFWINDDDTVGLPLVWGEAWPQSVMAVRSQPISLLARWVFERIWLEAVPVQRPDPAWDDMLALMNTGMTMEAASLALGISPRTGRRRIASAMDHYGVSSLFALGAAWSTRSETRLS